MADFMTFAFQVIGTVHVDTVCQAALSAINCSHALALVNDTPVLCDVVVRGLARSCPTHRNIPHV